MIHSWEHFFDIFARIGEGYCVVSSDLREEFINSMHNREHDFVNFFNWEDHKQMED